MKTKEIMKIEVYHENPLQEPMIKVFANLEYAKRNFNNSFACYVTARDEKGSILFIKGMEFGNDFWE